MKKWISANILIVVFLLLFLAMTVGYALYSQPISLNGQVTVQEAGRIEITSASILRNECSNLTSYSDPTYSGMHIEFEIKTRSTSFTATYQITVTNNSFYDYTYTGFPISAAIQGYDYVPNVTSTITYYDTGQPVENGQIIKSGESITVRLKMDFSVDRTQGEMTVIVNGDVSSSQDNTGSVTASVTPTTGSLKGEGTIAPFQLNVINTYSYRRTLNLTSSNENIIIVDAQGSPLSSVTINANETTSFPIYLMVKEGSIFLTETTTTNILVASNGIDMIDAGLITLEVDADVNATDHDKPEVGNVLINISESNPVEGQAIISWTRIDTGGSPITNYHITLYNETTGNTYEYDTGNAITTYTVSNLPAGTYYATVYGTDEAGNTGSGDCSGASTSNGYCSRSPSTALQWIFNVTTTLTGLAFEGEDTALIYSSYEGTLSINQWGAYSLPNTITVTMGGTQLTSGTDYTYDAGSGRVVVNRVTGNINIEAELGSSVCLVEDTPVLLADGTTKKIVDIDYDDLLMVYDHENGGLTYEYPIWIEKSETANVYQKTTFSDGSILKTVGSHNIFSMDENRYVNVLNKDEFHVGTRVIRFSADKTSKVVSVEKIEYVEEKINYYHVASTRYYNILAGGFLTTDGLEISSFLYTFDENLRWGKDREDYLAQNDLFKYEDWQHVFPEYLFRGLRMEEAKNILNHGVLDVAHIVEKLDFSKTKEIIQDENGTILWMVTTSDDIVTEDNKTTYLKEYKSTYVLPEPQQEENFIGWLNTGNNKMYQPGDEVEVIHGLHFIAKYESE